MAAGGEDIVFVELAGRDVRRAGGFLGAGRGGAEQAEAADGGGAGGKGRGGAEELAAVEAGLVVLVGHGSLLQSLGTDIVAAFSRRTRTWIMCGQRVSLW